MKTIHALITMAAVCGVCSGQSPDRTKPTAQGQNIKQAVIVEQLATSITFEKDGTGTRRVHAKFKVLSDAAAQQFGVLVFPYLAGNEEMQIDVHVQKPDGSIIKTPETDIQDLPADVTRAAPLYSDLHEKHVPVKALSVGDELEYDLEVKVKTAQIPNHFVLEYRRIEDAVVGQETLTVKVPQASQLSLASPDWQYTVSDEGAYKVYSWHGSRSEPMEESKRSTAEVAPTVELSNFRTWKEVADWYAELQKDRVAVTPAIAAKAAELTKAAKSDDERMRAIYNYVALKIRYVGIDFGIGRYQPHVAEEVMGDQYGDCKDKHTLLASLLSAVGIKAYPVLIGTERKLDTLVPSPAQFNHVITAVKRGSAWIFLDTTEQVAPFGMLLSPLRGKLALLVSDGPSSEVVTTPAEPPFEPYDHFVITAQLDEEGVLDGDAERTLRGDAEVLLRLAFRNTPEANWPDLVQKISYASGFGGDVTKVVVSDPDDTSQPLRISYHYHRKDFGDWADHRIPAPMPFISLPERKDLNLKVYEPLRLAAEAAEYKSVVQLPKGYAATVPPDAHLDDALADFSATFSVEKDVVTATRSLKFKAHEVPRSDDVLYDSLRTAVGKDYGAMIELSRANEGEGAPTVSENGQAQQLFWQASAAAQRRDFGGAKDLLRQVLKLDPNYPRAWAMLGNLYLVTGDADQGIEDMRKEVALHPQDAFVYRALAGTLMSLRRNRESEQVWRDLLKLEPEDLDAAVNVGDLLMREKKYPEAFAQYQTAVKAHPDSAALYEGLGDAALHSGNATTGLEALDKAVALDPEEANAVAYVLAEDNQGLDKALNYAKQAVAEQEKGSAAVSLDALDMEALKPTAQLGPNWDTLGWVYFKMGRLEDAERFLEAAWELSQDPVIGDHLGQVYERLHEPTKAAELYALALAGNRQMTETRERLEKVAGSSLKVSLAEQGAGGKLSRMREVRIPAKAGLKGSAEFFVLLSRDAKPAVKFISGSESMKALESSLTSAKFKALFPDEANVKLIRRGILDCGMAGCDFVLLLPSDVRSVN